VHYDYLVYGLALRASHWLPHLVSKPTCAGAATTDVSLDFGQPDGHGHATRLRFSDERGELGFVISSDARRVWCDWAEASTVPTIDDVAGMLVGPVLGCVLRLRGEISLHASVVGVGGRAVAILGSQGSGKSTMAAALAHAGHCVLSDDLAAITREDADWVVHPGYPRLRLAPASVRAFDLASARLPAVMSGAEKRYVRLASGDPAAGWRFGSDRLAIAAIYVLDRRPGTDRPRIESIPGPERLTTLMRHRSAQPFMSPDKSRQAREFAGLARLAADLPVRRINYPDSFQRLGLLSDLLLDDLAVRC
jgi:hypothetical protein